MRENETNMDAEIEEKGCMRWKEGGKEAVQQIQNKVWMQ